MKSFSSRPLRTQSNCYNFISDKDSWSPPVVAYGHQTRQENYVTAQPMAAVESGPGLSDSDRL